MRKSLLKDSENGNAHSSGSWLDIQQLASVELSSEDPRHTFEEALTDGGVGWKASTPGPQRIRLTFDSPQSIQRIHLEFREDHVERAQEIALLYASASSPSRELVRQQWSFSPTGSTSEVEDYDFDVHDVSTLELQIDPGRHEKSVFASLQSIRIR